MNKKRKHKTTKNTTPKPLVTRLRVIGVQCNGEFNLVTDFNTQEDFDKIFFEWFDNPLTKRWCAETLIEYIKIKQPNRICMLQEDYSNMIKNKAVIPATEEEWKSENN